MNTELVVVCKYLGGLAGASHMIINKIASRNQFKIPHIAFVVLLNLLRATKGQSWGRGGDGKEECIS